MKSKHLMIMLFITIIAALSSCSKNMITKDITYQTDTLIRHEVVSYTLANGSTSVGINNVVFKWSTGSLDSINIVTNIKYIQFIDKPIINIFYTYKKYRDGTYNYTIIETKPIVLYFPIK